MVARTAEGGDGSIDRLLGLAGDLKVELVSFVQGPRFARRLDVVLGEAADEDGFLDNSAVILAIDRFALQHRLPDGRTVLERFVAQRRPPLGDDEREMVSGWGEVVEACFEVLRVDGGAVLLHNLADDLVYRVHSTMGRSGFAGLREGMFFVGRIVPLHPAVDAWLTTGTYSPFPRSAGRRIAAAALEQVARDPGLLRRNPALWQRAWDVQAAHRADFIDQVGADLVVLPPHEAESVLREHYRRQQADLDAKGATTVADQAGRAVAGLPPADSLALVYDEVEGLAVYRDFGRLDALFADPALTRSRSHLDLLRSYLNDDSTSPLAIHRLVQRHPDGVDRVFRALLRKTGFSWPRDGEQLLRRYKKTHFDREPAPGTPVVGDRLAALLRGGSTT